ncbi:B3/4 domain-containing protein, partial [Acinetobacter baumannii]
VERELESEMLAICDAEKPVAVAGIMGGLESSITDKTTNVFLEVAYFRRDSIRRTSRRLGLSTEASYRFERGVDIENLIRASNRAAEL